MLTSFTALMLAPFIVRTGRFLFPSSELQFRKFNYESGGKWLIWVAAFFSFGRSVYFTAGGFLLLKIKSLRTDSHRRLATRNKLLYLPQCVTFSIIKQTYNWFLMLNTMMSSRHWFRTFYINWHFCIYLPIFFHLIFHFINFTFSCIYELLCVLISESLYISSSMSADSGSFSPPYLAGVVVH